MQRCALHRYTVASPPDFVARTTVITPPADRPVTYEQARWQLRLDDADDREYVLLLIDAVADYARVLLNMSIGEQTLRAVFQTGDLDPCDGRSLRLPYGPVASVESIIDGRGDLPAGRLEWHGALDLLRLDRRPSTHPSAWPVVVDYTAGVVCPPAVRLAILSHVAHLYENRLPAGKVAGELPHHLSRLYEAHSRADVVSVA